MLRKLSIALFGVLFLGLAACSSKSLQTIESDVPANTARNEDDVRVAILSALERRRWSVQRADRGQVFASIAPRGNIRVEIVIPYSANHYSIRYRDSEGLSYRNGKIHRNYNNWVINLDRTIKQELSSPTRYLNR
ncbi:hypothetical protein [Pseudomonas sp. LRF_L74]|uniref:hypothetical protein n=1 Tax=Pseudomonas sp. LRF_L74 TaxID=3369422 RepID=UPI003F618559